MTEKEAATANPGDVAYRAYTSNAGAIVVKRIKYMRRLSEYGATRDLGKLSLFEVD